MSPSVLGCLPSQQPGRDGDLGLGCLELWFRIVLASSFTPALRAAGKLLAPEIPFYQHLKFYCNREFHSLKIYSLENLIICFQAVLDTFLKIALRKK